MFHWHRFNIPTAPRFMVRLARSWAGKDQAARNERGEEEKVDDWTVCLHCCFHPCLDLQTPSLTSSIHAHRSVLIGGLVV
jgi:hypothetical protein